MQIGPEALLTQVNVQLAHIFVSESDNWKDFAYVATRFMLG